MHHVNVYEFGVAVVTSSQSSVFVVTPAVGVEGDNTVFSVSLTWNFLGSGGKWKDDEFIN